MSHKSASAVIVNKGYFDYSYYIKNGLSSQSYFRILITLENFLDLVFTQKKTILSQILLSMFAILRLTNSVIIPVGKVRHKRRRILLRLHFVPINVLQPWVPQYLVNPIRAQSLYCSSFEQSVDKVDAGWIPVFRQLMWFDRGFVKQHLFSNLLSVVSSVRSLSRIKVTFPSMHS